MNCNAIGIYGNLTDEKVKIIITQTCARTLTHTHTVSLIIICLNQCLLLCIFLTMLKYCETDIQLNICRVEHNEFNPPKVS